MMMLLSELALANSMQYRRLPVSPLPTGVSPAEVSAVSVIVGTVRSSSGSTASRLRAGFALRTGLNSWRSARSQRKGARRLMADSHQGEEKIGDRPDPQSSQGTADRH